MTEQTGSNRIKVMVVEAVVIAVLLAFFHYYQAVLGLVLGTAISIINFRLVCSAPSLDRVMKRYLLRLIIAGAVLVAAAFVGTGFLLGSLVGLTMEMQAYLWEALKELLGSRFAG